MVDSQGIIERLLEMVKNVSTAYRRHDLQILEKVKRDSELLAPKINIVKKNQGVEYIEKTRQEMDKLVDAIEEKINNKLLFSEKAVNEMDILLGGLITYLGNIKDYFATGNQVLEHHIKKEAGEYEKLTQDFATMHEERLVQGICLARASGVYLNMLSSISSMFHNLKQFATYN